MSVLFYSKEFARYGHLAYSLRAQCDESNEYYTCTVTKRSDETVTALLTFPAEVFEVMLERIPHVFNSFYRERTWITTMEINNTVPRALQRQRVLPEPSRLKSLSTCARRGSLRLHRAPRLRWNSKRNHDRDRQLLARDLLHCGSTRNAAERDRRGARRDRQPGWDARWCAQADRSNECQPSRVRADRERGFDARAVGTKAHFLLISYLQFTCNEHNVFCFFTLTFPS